MIFGNFPTNDQELQRMNAHQEQKRLGFFLCQTKRSDRIQQDAMDLSVNLNFKDCMLLFQLFILFYSPKMCDEPSFLCRMWHANGGKHI